MSADPDMTFDHQLGESGPVVQFRYGSVRDWMKYRRQRDAMLDLNTTDAVEPALSLLESMLAPGQDIDIAEHLTSHELLMLASKLEQFAMLAELEKKSSQLPSPSPKESSAKDAGTAAAPMHQAVPAPPHSSVHHAAVAGVSCVTVTDDGI